MVPGTQKSRFPGKSSIYIRLLLSPTTPQNDGVVDLFTTPPYWHIWRVAPPRPVSCWGWYRLGHRPASIEAGVAVLGGWTFLFKHASSIYGSDSDIIDFLFGPLHLFESTSSLINYYVSIFQVFFSFLRFPPKDNFDAFCSLLF